mmetsp:Transcript_17750/g.51802  ORF Transcript_17750/g.51802 Transcript_17750/m.51802 type:complete len:216 (+) Transcript_17750:316-963(+)
MDKHRHNAAHPSGKGEELQVLEKHAELVLHIRAPDQRIHIHNEAHQGHQAHLQYRPGSAQRRDDGQKDLGKEVQQQSPEGIRGGGVQETEVDVSSLADSCRPPHIVLLPDPPIVERFPGHVCCVPLNNGVGAQDEDVWEGEHGDHNDSLQVRALVTDYVRCTGQPDGVLHVRVHEGRQGPRNVLRPDTVHCLRHRLDHGSHQHRCAELHRNPEGR